MKAKQLLIALIFGLTLTVPAAPGSQAMPGRPAVELPPLAFAAPTQQPAAGPSPTAGAPPAPAGEGGEDTAVPEEIANVPGVTEDWWQKVQAQILGDLYSFSAEPAEGGAPAFRGTNPDHGFDLTFAAGVARLGRTGAGPEGAAGEPSWTWELRTTGYGYEGDVRPLPAPDETASDGNRLEFRRAGLAEWYVNDDRGLEQGFTLDAPPPGGANAGPLVLEMALDTGLVPVLGSGQVITDGQAIEFTRADGNVVLLRYSDLAAYDAAGQPLPARLELSGCGREASPGSCTLRIVVDVTGAAYPLTVDPLIATPSWSAVGENAYDHFGYSVAAAGDVNGDGYADLVVGARDWDCSLENPQAWDCGKVYVYHGSPAGLEDMPAWSRSGDEPGDYFGYSVSTAGDVNGDGYDDLVVGAPWNDGEDAGKVYVYHGSPAGLGAIPTWTVVGENAGDTFGRSVATAGDVNGDGYDDLVVGAPYNDHNGENAGKAYVYYGSPAGLSTGGPDWSIGGAFGFDNFGASVATAGDVNGDGYDDLVVGAPGNDGNGTDAGKVYVYYGSQSGLGIGGPDWNAAGENAYDYFGRSVATAGDVNGDEDADLVVGAPGWDTGRGKAYVYHGKTGGLVQDDPADWTTAGENAYDHFGWSVATAGNVNGDPYADLVVGARDWDCSLENPQAWDCGKAYVFHGSAAGLGAIPTWTVVGENAGDTFGDAVATAGDVNGDGYADLVVGAPGYDGQRGKAYVYHGTALGLTPAFDWTAGGEAEGDTFGYAVAAAGDVDGDGYADLVVGAHAYDGGRGKAYVYRGSPVGLAGTPAWSAAGEHAGDFFGRSVATAGDVNGDGYDDLVVGAPYNDEDGTSAGKAYVFHGSAAGLGAIPAWTASGVNAYDNFGASVATAGDVNGDGYADLVVGAVGYPQGKGNGQAYVFHGGPAGLTTGAADWTASGEHASDHFGYAVGTAGDVNGDGCADLVAGAWGYDGPANTNAGRAYVYHGCSPVGLGTAAAFTATGLNGGDYLGWAVGTAGDVDGDGYSDLAVGAWGYDDAGDSDAGRVDLYRGGSAGITTTSAISLTGEIAGEHFGYALGTAGDVDGDGYADLIVGAEGYQYALGQAYLFRGSAAGLTTGAAAWTATGARGGDHFGAAVGTAGDVNGDGYSDLVAGAWGYDDPANTNAGRAYVYHGAAAGLGGTPWTAVGDWEYKRLGVSVATAGDVNGDGFADLAVGEASIDGHGETYVYHGSADGLPQGDPPEPDWTAGGEYASDYFGGAVGTAGDVNGDGYADLVVGVTGYDDATNGDDAGRVCVYHGSADGLPQGDPPEPDWTDVGQNADELFGYSVGTAGDVNGDGYADVIVGATGYLTSTGRAYVYYGSADGLPQGDPPKADWTNGGENVGDRFGYAVATAGDVNGDGYADVVVGAGGYGNWRGKAYVYYGSPAGLGGAPAWTAAGENVGDDFGHAVATAGDVNGDGYADLVVFAPGYDNWRGRVYIYHGSPHGLDVPYSTFSGGDAGETDEGAISSVGTAGDVDGDGYADLVVGASRAFTDTGRVYIYHGSPWGLSPTFDPVAAGEKEGDRFGEAVATAGDVNGDGYADLVVGAWAYDDLTKGTYTGKVYAYQGNDGGGRVSLARQLRGDGSGQPVQPWGPAYTADSFGVSLHAVDPLGRGRARLEVEACPPGVPFGDGCLDRTSEKWIEVSSGGEVELSLIVYGLPEFELYRWRGRALYDSPLYRHGPWRRLLGQALEADVRVTRLAADLSITKTMAPEEPVGSGAPITYTLTFASNGPARGVVITDILSSDIISTSVSSSGAPITDTGHLPCCVWAVRDLEAGEGGVITITGVAQADRFVNTAVITGTSPDPNPANNQATVQTHVLGILYVDRDARGADNGLSWANAYTDLQDALAEAKAGDQIWIAEGVYRPVASGLRSSSFQLKSGVALHGGFAGTERWLYERDPVAYPTVLSGDIGTKNNPHDNVYHVVTAGSGVTETAVLEGLTIAGGNADGNGENGRGGGLFNQGGSPTLVNVAFVGNAANRGGGLYNGEGSPTLVNVTFSGNTAESEGGGIYNLSSSPVLTNATFSHNAANQGGGLYNAAGSAIMVTNAIVWGNTGGQIANYGTASVNYSDVQGGCPSGATCDHVIKQDPQLWNAGGEDGLAGTLDDDLRIYTTFRHPSPVIDQGDNSALPFDTWDLDGDGITDERLPLDLSGRWRLVGFTVVTPTVDMGAYEATIVDVLAEGQSLFEQGESFRLENLQLLSSDTLADALKNYSNFNDGKWYNAFCADYNGIDADGYCPDSDPPPGIRNTLLDAVDLYRVAVGYPASEFTPRRGEAIDVWENGGRGVMSATIEIANVHLIFGNEFLVDATDYRFSTGGIPYADQIIAQEQDELAQAQRQFELIIDLVFRAFNEWGVGQYCTGDQYEQAGMASSLMMSTLNEIAARHYMLRDSEKALEVYDRAYTDQYLHLMALAEMAAASGDEYLRNGSWEMLNNLSQMRERAQAIHDGLDFFGFAPDYVPLQAYEQLLLLTEGPAGSTGLLGTARDLEDQARDAQRTFDANASAMATELDNLKVELENQLFELCGNDFEVCEGGLMLQNLDALDAASLRAGLALMQAQNLAEQVQIEEERKGHVITVRLGLGQELSAAELAIGALRAQRTTTTKIASSEDRVHAGIEVAFEGYLQQEWKFGLLPGFESKGGFKESLTAKAGYEHAWSWIGSTETKTDWNEADIGEWESSKALKQAVAEAEIEGANSAAVVRNLVLQELEALEEYKVAIAELNKLADEHNSLAERRSRLLKMREQAINRVASHNSHLLNPAYRIWRDSLTTQSLQAHALAAQFAYLTARAAEYELLTPYPDLGRIFRARTSNDIRLFLDGLAVWVQALDLPGQLNRYPYTLSLARDLWGLTDQALDPEGALTGEELRQKRYEEFQRLLASNIVGNRLEVWFSTALDQQRAEGQYLFSPNIWNNRVAGVGAPLAQNQGVWMNIVTRQASAVDGVEAVLIHGGSAGGAEAYRNALGQTVYYDPGTAVPVGYKLPAALAPKNTTVVLRPGINGAGAIANSGLINLSVAASSWTLRIPAESRGNLDYSQIEDIQLVLDTTGRALPGLAGQAERDARRLQAGLEMEPVEIEPQLELPSSTPPAIGLAQSVTAPALAGQIGGSYSGYVMVTSPITIAIQVLDVDVWNTGGTLTGTIDAEEGSLYPAHVGLHGVAVGDAFNLTSDPFVTTVADRTVTQTLMLVGHAEEEGDVLKAVYTGTITNLLPEPILVQGKFVGSRPGTSGSERLVLEAGAWSVQPSASTAITATLYDEAMELITETRTLTFTTDLGSVTPAVADTVDGQAVVTFHAGTAQGQATVVATTGAITSEVRIEISDLAPPLADFAATPVSGTVPLTVTYTDLSLHDPNGWAWDFGDGTGSTERHPTHVYSAGGTYSVSLTASNALAADRLTKPGYIVVVEPMAPEAQFSADPTSGVAPLTVTFTDESAHAPTGWSWDFGDGGSSTEQHPVYTYYAAGTFTVTLTVSNTVGTDTVAVPGCITVEQEKTRIYLPLVMRNAP